MAVVWSRFTLGVFHTKFNLNPAGVQQTLSLSTLHHSLEFTDFKQVHMNLESLF